MLKGVCRPEDARRAVESGFDAVWVSNHGGRQLETSPPTIDLLPKVRVRVRARAGVRVMVRVRVTKGEDLATHHRRATRHNT